MTLDEKIKEFLTGSDSGYGDGSGCLSGGGFGGRSGYGYGSGSGKGWHCCESNYGYGSGSGYSSGDGCGVGSGYGRGYSSDNGYDCGLGRINGISSFCGEMVYRVDSVNTLIHSVRGNVAHGSILNSDLTLTPCYIVKQDIIFAHGETLREAIEALHDKLFEDMPDDDRIDAFLQDTDREKAYPTQYFYDWHHRLTGSCDIGRKQFAIDHDVDLERGMMTMREFLRLTKDAYGGNVIQRVIERLSHEE